MYKILNFETDQSRKHRYLALFMRALATAFLAISADLLASTEFSTHEFDQDILQDVAELYGISEDQAVDRLAHESESALVLRQVESLPLKSYAGSWFDASIMKLKVAITDPDDLTQLSRLDVEPVLVAYSLETLQNRRSKATGRLTDTLVSSIDVLSSYIDIRSNTVVLGVDTLLVNSAESELHRAQLNEMVEVVAFEGRLELSSGPFRAADGTRNLTWQTPGVIWPCSIGAPVENGYVTAGHCGFAGNSIADINQVLLGAVQSSMWEDTTHGQDIGYVETVAGWTPTGEVNGYTDGNFSISAERAGLIQFPVGSTVCRYGQTTGGPNCSTLVQIDANIAYPARTITGLSIVDASCTSDGDSGGTWVAGTGQIQGIHVGGQPFNNNDQCPTIFVELYFQPIKDALNEYNVTMLTSHGSNAPQINFTLCPDPANSGGGDFDCELKKVDSQGEVQLQWISSTGHSSTQQLLSGSCAKSDTVTVTLQATNPYGTDTKYYSFKCPSRPLP